MSDKEQDDFLTAEGKLPFKNITWIPIDIHDHALKYTGYEFKIIMAIGLRTWRFQKLIEVDQTAEITKETSIPKKKVDLHIKDLKEKNVLLEIAQGAGRQPQLIVNPDVESWLADKKKKSHLKVVK